MWSRQECKEWVESQSLDCNRMQSVEPLRKNVTVVGALRRKHHLDQERAFVCWVWARPHSRRSGACRSQ